MDTEPIIVRGGYSDASLAKHVTHAGEVARHVEAKMSAAPEIMRAAGRSR